MLRRYIKQLVDSMFSKDTTSFRTKNTEIQRQVARLKKIQQSAKHRQRPRKKETVL